VAVTTAHQDRQLDAPPPAAALDDDWPALQMGHEDLLHAEATGSAMPPASMPLPYAATLAPAIQVQVDVIVGQAARQFGLPQTILYRVPVPVVSTTFSRAVHARATSTARRPSTRSNLLVIARP